LRRFYVEATSRAKADASGIERKIKELEEKCFTAAKEGNR